MTITQAVKIDMNGTVSHVDVDLSSIKSCINVIEDGSIDVLGLNRNLDLWYSTNKAKNMNAVAINLVRNLAQSNESSNKIIHGNVFITKVDDVTGELIPLTPEDMANIDLAQRTANQTA